MPENFCVCVFLGFDAWGFEGRCQQRVLCGFVLWFIPSVHRFCMVPMLRLVNSEVAFQRQTQGQSLIQLHTRNQAGT